MTESKITRRRLCKILTVVYCRFPQNIKRTLWCAPKQVCWLIVYRIQNLLLVKLHARSGSATCVHLFLCKLVEFTSHVRYEVLTK